MREQTQLPDDCFRPASMSLNMSKHVRRWFSADLVIRSFIELVDCLYKTQEPTVHQAQLWSLDTLKGMLSSTIFVEYNDRIDDGYGARTGYDFLFDNARLGANETRELRPRIKLVIYQGTLYFEEELPINHPLQIFPDLDRGWDFKKKREAT